MSQRIFMLLQMNEQTPARAMRFMPYQAVTSPEMREIFSAPDRPVNTLHYTDYDLVYTGEMEDNDNLETLWSRFNIGSKPNGYLGVSMSMSDVVVIIDDNSAQACYVDMGPYQALDERFFTGIEVAGGGCHSPVFEAIVDTTTDYVAFDKHGNFIGVWYVPQGAHFKDYLKWYETQRGILTHPITREEATGFRLLPPPQCLFLFYLKQQGWIFDGNKNLIKE